MITLVGEKRDLRDEVIFKVSPSRLSVIKNLQQRHIVCSVRMA